MKSGTDISMIHTTEDDDADHDGGIICGSTYIRVILPRLPLVISRTTRRWRYDNDDDNEHEERTERIRVMMEVESNDHIIMAREIICFCCFCVPVD
mmetsp:Transcript_64752/g.72383  ORF Transcript_64752/g.72383 Transcript_64752/m.72383 type:complete len:96 (-) Transcript_64752:72-359(-)